MHEGAHRTKQVARWGRTNALVTIRVEPFGIAERQRLQRALPVGAMSIQYVFGRVLNVMRA